MRARLEKVPILLARHALPGELDNAQRGQYTLLTLLSGWPTGLYAGGVAGPAPPTAAARRRVPERCAGAAMDRAWAGGQVMLLPQPSGSLTIPLP